MKNKIGAYPFMAEPFHCDFEGRLFMGHLGNHLINAADFHSNDRGFGMLYLNTIGKTWVLSRLAIEMTEMPKAYDRFVVATWVENAMRFFTQRNFAITAKEDERKVYGYGRSVWAMIDTDTRQPADLFSVNGGVLKDYVESEKTCPIEKPSRVKMGEGAELQRTIHTAYSDIDMNGHVNSIKYIEHTLDLWTPDWYAHHPIRRIDVAFVAEAHLGDDLLFFREQTGDGCFSVRIMKREKETTDPEEVCRCAVTFHFL